MGKAKNKRKKYASALKRKAKQEFGTLNDKNDPGGLKRLNLKKTMDTTTKFMMSAEQKLGIPKWSQMNLEPVQKNFYCEHPAVKARDEATVQKYKDENRITVQGLLCPKPVLAFEELNFPEPIMAAIKSQNFVSPTPIQSQALPIAMSGKDLIGIADTGSGKTLAYILPAIIHILGKKNPRNIGQPDVVVLAPTRELAVQIHEVVLSLGPDIKVNSECFYGGVKREEMMLCAEKVFEICIATPGRMIDFLILGVIKLNRCTYFVLDEADRMLDMGFEPQIRAVLNQARPDRQLLMFSATWPQVIQELSEKYLKDYIKINIGSLQISANHNITQKVIVCEEAEKQKQIVAIMQEIMPQEENKTLIFCNSKVDVDYLTLKFRLNGWEACSLHGNLKQNQREQVFGDFKSGNIRILIATDLAARGLDVDDIKFIINYDYPNQSEDYVHRIGRTGRCNRAGTAITFFTNKDRDGAKKLISVLQEANQEVTPELQHLASLPHLGCRYKKTRKETKLKRREMNQLVKCRTTINQVPLGTERNSENLPDLEGITLPENFYKTSKPGKRSRTESKQAKEKNGSSQLEKPWKMAKVDHGEPSDSHVASSEDKLTSNSQTSSPASGTGTAIKPPVPNSQGIKRDGSSKKVDSPGNNFQANNNQQWVGGQNFRMPFNNTDTRFPMGHGGVGMNMPVNHRYSRIPMGSRYRGMPMDSRYRGMPMDFRNTAPMPGGLRRGLGPPPNQRYGGMNWSVNTVGGNSPYNSYGGHQNFAQGDYSSRFSLSRADTERYSPQSSFSGRGGYDQSSNRRGSSGFQKMFIF